MRTILRRVSFFLYGAAVLFYFLRYNNGLDSGLPGLLAALQMELLGSANEKITIIATAIMCFIPYFAATAVIQKFLPQQAAPGLRVQPEWPENLLSAGIIVAILAVGAHFFIASENEARNSAIINRLDLNASGELPENARFVSAFGRIQSNYLFAIRHLRSGRVERATIYVPFTAKNWAPDKPVSYILQLDYGYARRPSADGRGETYYIDDSERYAGKAFEAEISAAGVPVAVARSYERDGGLKLATKLYLLKQTAFVGGKPRNPYEDLEPLVPWLLPAGLPAAGLLLILGLIGFARRRRQAAA
jgi:hypothetical protein